MGYKLYQPQNVIGRGFVNCWIHTDLVKNDQYVKNQTMDHYCSVIQFAGILISKGKQPKVYHSDEVDIACDNIGYEYEHPNSHNLQEIIAKKARGLLKYDRILFIGSKANEAVLIEGAGKDFVVKRGKQLENWLTANLNSDKMNDSLELQENGLKIPEEI